ncbi:putative quinol monooxygenase [Deinococcus sp.]|uniref:putative quinol monooxygenase n=1 Tax=Deinococcus sp. TaxID=47478 RepID=UPI002869B1D2|nr:putative quinol monooxygenase [Deinococcus sp.]
MIICHGTLSTPPEHADAARGLLRQIAQATRNEPGCTLYLVSEDLERPGHFLFAEHWNAMADLQTHLALPGVGEAVAAAHSLGATDLTITAYEGGAATKIM